MRCDELRLPREGMMNETMWIVRHVDGDIRVKAVTKSEARAVAKARLGIPEKERLTRPV